MSDALSRWLERFWFLRGVAAALAVVQLVPVFVDLSAYEFLRAFHALIVGWNLFAAWVGSLIGTLPFIPDLEPVVVNALLFAGSIGVPSAFAFAGGFEERRRSRLSWTPSWLDRPMAASAFVSMVVVSYLAFVWAITGEDPFGVSPLADAASIDGKYNVGDLELLFGDLDSLTGVLSQFSIIFLILTNFCLALWKLKGYARGLIFIAVFILTMQALYWINAPWIADRINDLANSVLSESSASPSEPAAISSEPSPSTAAEESSAQP
jgi:hypothetical protein